MSNIVLQAKGLNKTFRDGERSITVIDQLDFSLQAGEQVAIIGSSGSGKSTLLNMLGGLDTPSSGQVMINQQDLYACSEKQRAALRNQALGFVYQFHHLLPEFSALENVAMPLLLRKQPIEQVRAKATELLTEVGLAHRLTHKPAQLSGGERQRVAIARALVGEPACVLMDEPTGNLDRHTAEDVQLVIDRLNQDKGIAFILVTHDTALAARTSRILELKEGQLVVSA
ncbi:lipoprotein-releasing ABC transporter ATP-binding protein LolD [Neptuniibacter sp. CAU 1671]|uniref:lipoprotein-releasing ABC transporter ATP-binding protein LolD n=1 Tax=Neptuniibacter sp. CAU 1671 TaxID=3032593 RepID=UPI0023DBBF91|nr:lipoprotein-releasing ABC transporter ATP-binding protein LolD [Neptuniibacter sp. CAU 1671]MDF2180810.1 lipoprotein-releasing ABC transporter ATP-binding protein LolD [Neptuniibacter sp. CAU 1671]